MKRCRTCLYPDSKPDLYFDETGECSACINYRNRPSINWEARKKDLLRLLDRHEGRVIVPSSGGKDSTYIVMTLLELGADVTIVTARTCMLTDIGRKNIDNLARYARTIEVVPNMTVRAKLNRLGLEMVGDISWPEHVSIFTTPFRMATKLGINLIMYGENPQDQYGGPVGTEQARTMTRRWTQEFGGFLGLRPNDLVGHEGITEKDMGDYQMPGEWSVVTTGLGHGQEPWGGLEAHFLGQYVQWNSHHNAETSQAAGMHGRVPTEANLWWAENQDNAQTGIHDWFGWLKYGYGRGCAQISASIRAEGLERSAAVEWLKKYDGKFPDFYMGVPYGEVLDRIGMTHKQFDDCIQRFTNTELFTCNGNEWPKLKDWGC